MLSGHLYMLYDRIEMSIQVKRRRTMKNDRLRDVNLLPNPRLLQKSRQPRMQRVISLLRMVVMRRRREKVCPSVPLSERREEKEKEIRFDFSLVLTSSFFLFCLVRGPVRLSIYIIL